MAKTVFISHSHRDRDTALYLDRVLKKRGATTFLDHEQLEPGASLPDSIEAGIRGSDVFLLLWSMNSSRSAWCTREWNVAYDARKKIVPYLLDQTERPEGLEALLGIEARDKDSGHAALFRAVFGKNYAPTAGEVFPGKWRIDVDVYGMAGAWFEVELISNGQVTGKAGASLGKVGGLVGEAAARAWPVSGTWRYDDQQQLLILALQRETLEIYAKNEPAEELHGQDTKGRTYRARRLASDGLDDLDERRFPTEGRWMYTVLIASNVSLVCEYEVFGRQFRGHSVVTLPDLGPTRTEMSGEIEYRKVESPATPGAFRIAAVVMKWRDTNGKPTESIIPIEKADGHTYTSGTEKVPSVLRYLGPSQK